MTLKIYVKIRFGHICVCFGAFFCDASTNNLFNNASFRFQKYEKMFNQKIYLREKPGSNIYLFLLWTCFSKKRENIGI